MRRLTRWAVGLGSSLVWAACGPKPQPPPAAPAPASDVESPQSRFVRAAGRGDFGEVDRRLLAGDVDIDGVGPDGTNALLEAIKAGELAMTKRLLDGGAAPDKAINGLTPLVASAEASVHADAIAEALLDAGASPDRGDQGGRRPLVEHAHRGHWSAVKTLLARGADASAADRSGATALHAAAGGGHPVVVESLLVAGAAVDAADRAGVTPLMLAAASGHLETMNALLKRGAVPTRADRSGRRPLGFALVGGHLPAAELLLDAGEDPAAVVWPAEGTGLHLVAARDHVAAAAVLVKAKASLEPLHLDRTPLMVAARRGRIAMVRWLVSRGARVDATGGDGVTALHVAAGAGQATIVGLLLDAGADRELRDAEGQRPVDLARQAGHDAIVERLSR